MRIITGRFKKMRLYGPRSTNIRPTSDKVKGALFNVLGEMKGKKVLDLYAGTGNLGLEAFSRGASEVVFVDSNRFAVRLIRRNIQKLGLREEESAKLHVFPRRAEEAIPWFYAEGRCFDMILADPPYSSEKAFALMDLLQKHPIWERNALLAVETSAKDEMKEVSFARRVFYRVYGETALQVFQCFRGG